MAEEAPEQEQEQAEEPKKKSLPKMLIACLITALLAGGTGAAIPVALMGPSTDESSTASLLARWPSSHSAM